MNKILENNIVLNKDTHEYRLLSEPELTFTSVTTFVDSFFEGFDSLKIATNLVQNHPRYAGYTVDEFYTAGKFKILSNKCILYLANQLFIFTC